MAIRITGYSQSSIPSESTTHPLPTIHVEGESIGSDCSPHDVRRFKGTVGMIDDGAIHWSLVSCAQFFALCCYALCMYYTNAKSDSEVSSAPAPASRSGRRRWCRLGGQVQRWGCWDCGPVHCMRGRIRLVSAAVLLCMGLLVDTSGCRSILGLEGRLESGHMDM